MAQVMRSLEEISTVYRIFEKDQVLTHDQLNSIARYFDDQTRLTRTKLIGVGIVCGLRPSVEDGEVKVTKGVGVTTDGDLITLDADTFYDRFKRYDESNPAYPPFSLNETLIKLFELVPQGVEEPRATPLKRFRTEAGASLDDMAALLFMESYVKDDDLCSGTDCDNLGKDCVNTLKLLLLDKRSAAALMQAIGVPDEAAGALNPVVADRPLLPSSLTALSQLAAIYRASCGAIHKKLAAELPKIYQSCEPFLKDEFPTDPAAGWVTQLNAIRTNAADLGIQYYYDFLKDLVETYNDFRERLFGDTVWCCPDIDAFPKHLLLGNLVPGDDPDENRTGFYPSPIAGRSADQLNHAKFLIRKISALIQAFKVPAANAGEIRVTPSCFEDRPLEERAIPYYYPVSRANAVHKSWSHRLSRRRMEAYNYGYHAAAYEAQGGAAAPLTSQIGAYSFFRIEGHLGRPVAAALTEIENLIKTNNLPFTVRAVLLGSERGLIVKRPGIRYTDLHRFHFLVRQDLTHRLEEVKDFSGKFKLRVDVAVTDEPNAPALKSTAERKDANVKEKAESARTKLNRSYAAYRADPTWMNDLNEATTAAGDFKFDLSEVVKTEFTTPFDSLIGTTNDRWLDWLDEIINRKDQKEEEKLFFTKFSAQHPGVEHFGGVSRGGTFVLLHDGRTVVADVMLSYVCCETEEEEADETPLPGPKVKPGWIDPGIRIVPSLDKIIKTKINVFETELDKKWNPKLDLQKDYFNVFKESVGMMGNVLIDVGKGKAPTVSGGKLTDNLLDLRVNEAKLMREKVDLLNRKAADPALAEEVRTKLQEEVKAAETGLAKSLEETTRYISESGADVSTEGEGFKAMLEVSSGFALLTDTETLKIAKTGLTGVQKSTDNPALKVVIGNMLKR